MVRLAHNWPPARRAFALEGMVEQWSNGIMGLKVFFIFFNVVPLLLPKFSPIRRRYEPEANTPTFHSSIRLG